MTTGTRILKASEARPLRNNDLNSPITAELLHSFDGGLAAYALDETETIGGTLYGKVVVSEGRIYEYGGHRFVDEVIVNVENNKTQRIWYGDTTGAGVLGVTVTDSWPDIYHYPIAQVQMAGGVIVSLINYRPVSRGSRHWQTFTFPGALAHPSSVESIAVGGVLIGWTVTAGTPGAGADTVFKVETTYAGIPSELIAGDRPTLADGSGWDRFQGTEWAGGSPQFFLLSARRILVSTVSIPGAPPSDVSVALEWWA